MISILMPFKDEELYIEEAVLSVLNQTYTNFHLILIDDHSCDNSLQIVKSLALKDNRMTVMSNLGIGIIEALKAAQEQAYGKYITRQDADDLMPKDKLEVLKNQLDRYGQGHISTGKVKYFSDHDLGNGFKNYENWINELSSKQSHYEQLFKECVLVSSNWLMYLSDFEKISGFTPATYPEDYHFVFRLYESKFKIVSVDNITHLWRDHPKRASRNLEEYKDQKFFKLKVSYFKKFYSSKNIILWGAGKTGKKLAKELIAQNIPFSWVTNNEKKIGKIIYTVPISPLERLTQISDPYVIISVTQRGAMGSIKAFLKENHLKNFFEF